MSIAVAVKNGNTIANLFTGVKNILSVKDFSSADRKDLNGLVADIEHISKKHSLDIVNDDSQSCLSEETYDRIKTYLEPIESILEDYDCEMLVRVLRNK